MGTWGQIVKRAREDRGWTLRQMADELDVSPSTVLRWETGEIDPPLSTVRQVNAALGLDEERAS